MIARYLLGFLIVLVLSIDVGCGASAPVRHSSTPATLGSVDSLASEAAALCDSYGARYQRSPLRLRDGTPVWCF